MQTTLRTTCTALAGLALSIGALNAHAQPQPPRAPQPPAPHAAPHTPAHPNVSPVQPARVQAPPPAPHQAHAPARPGAHAAPQGAGPDHKWVRGTKVPAQYRTPHYVVHDWKRHGLKQPPRGQQWVQYGKDYLLVSIASGVIAQLVLGH